MDRTGAQTVNGHTDNIIQVIVPTKRRYNLILVSSRVSGIGIFVRTGHNNERSRRLNRLYAHKVILYGYTSIILCRNTVTVNSILSHSELKEMCLYNVYTF